MKIILFMVAWILGCFVADTYMSDVHVSWVMVWGMVCAFAGMFLLEGGDE